LDSNMNAAAVGFKVQNADNSWIDNKHSGVLQTRSYIGCAHMLNRRHFLSVGGYDESLVHMCEEMDFSAMAFRQNLFCYHHPCLTVRHEYALEGRSWSRMAYYGSRNHIRWSAKHLRSPKGSFGIC
jgi:predicted glycosyltransferase involved in capsule biosynthesis